MSVYYRDALKTPIKCLCGTDSPPRERETLHIPFFRQTHAIEKINKGGADAIHNLLRDFNHFL